MSGVEAAARPAGKTGAGQEITELSLDNGWMRVAVLTYGATVVAVEMPDRTGARRNVVVRLPDLAAYEAVEGRAYVGSTIGRFARIVPDGELDLDGRRHRLALNEGGHHIHGGPEGFDARVWNGDATGGEESGRIALSLRSPDGDQGYPGNLSCTAVFELDPRNRLTVTFEATTDRPTLCGLSNHVFWNLAGADTIDGQSLRLNSTRVVESGPDFVPTGETVSVAGTHLDFGAPSPLRGVAVDKFFAVPPESWSARLSDPGSGRRLEVGTDQSGMAVYTGEILPTARAGICLQPGPWPYTARRTSFPSAVLRPGETYRSQTTFSLEVLPHD